MENGWTIEAITPSFAKLEFICEAMENKCLFTHIESFGFIKSKKADAQKISYPVA
jgi:hypothetical protein